MIHEAVLHVIITDDVSQRESYRASTPIPASMEEYFEGVNICSDALGAMISRKSPTTEHAYRVLHRKREGYAKMLAEHLTAEIVKAMEAQDQRNGYPK